MTSARHEEIAELLGAYALDAFEPDEARAVEEHAAECPRCRAELARHREVAAALGNAGAPAPEGVWERIGAELGLEGAGSRGQAPAVSSRDVAALALGERRAPRPRRSRRAAVVAISAAIAAAAALAVVAGVLTDRISRLDRQVAAMQQALHARSGLSRALAASVDPRDAQVVLRPSAGSTGQVACLAVDRSSGAAWFIGAALASLLADRTYPLWTLVRGQPVSISILGAVPTATALHVARGMTRFMVTDEPAGARGRPARSSSRARSAPRPELAARREPGRYGSGRADCIE